VNEKILKALIEAGAVKKIRLVAEGSLIYVEASTGAEFISAKTNKGQLKTWASIDTASKWVRRLGVGAISLDISRWQPDQKELSV
jgi:hypothetical protein